MTDIQVTLLGSAIIIGSCFISYQIKTSAEHIIKYQSTITGFMICKEPSPNTTMTCKEYEPTKY